jgi:hypothetical protein
MRSRIRLVLSGAVVVFAAATALFNGAPWAIATQGQAVIAGAINTENSDTVFQLSDPDTPTCGSGNLIGVHACGWSGVFGEGRFIGVKGEGPTGVSGVGGTTGVSGSGTENGVEGTGANGVYGEGTENGVQAKGGTFGVFATGSDYGVYASAPSHGVFGQATSSGGAGIDASGSNGALALRVTGKAKFSRSGITTIAAGASSKTISLGGVTTASMVLATSQQNSSVFVRSAVPASGSFTIRLSGPAPTGGLKVAYFVLN